MCEHSRFYCQTDVTRLTDDNGVVTAYAADIVIRCNECGCQFAFVGPAAGYSFTGPMVSADRTELRVPLVPVISKYVS
jgi:hypothetical protein